MGQRTRILCLSSLYPSSALPRHGIFIENRMRSLVESGRVDLKILSPTPWFPFANDAFGKYAAFARVPHKGERFGLEIVYPRYPTLPKVGMNIAPFLMARALRRPIERMMNNGFDFDILDCYYFYPDGVAAAWLGRKLGKPVIISALGNDLSLIPHHQRPRRMIQWAASQASGMTTVCQALKDALVDLGVAAERVDVVLHGVDLELFQPPQDRQAIRAEVGFHRRTLLSVGHLIERKGHHIAIEALPQLPEVDLVIIGDGEEEANLKRQVKRLSLEDRVRFLGHVDQRNLPVYYGAADALVLASSREGIANVMIESLACGTPVLATKVWGAPEVIVVPEAGVLIEKREPESLVAAARQLLSNYPDRQATRRFATRFSWEQTTIDHLQVVDRILSNNARPDLAPAPSVQPS